MAEWQRVTRGGGGGGGGGTRSVGRSVGARSSPSATAHNSPLPPPPLPSARLSSANC